MKYISPTLFCYSFQLIKLNWTPQIRAGDNMM